LAEGPAVAGGDHLPGVGGVRVAQGLELPGPGLGRLGAGGLGLEDAQIPEAVLERVGLVRDLVGELEPRDDDVAIPGDPVGVGDELADEELVSWSDAEDRLEHERHLEESPDAPLSDAGQVGSESGPATFANGIGASDREESQERPTGN
jgi:hypothetical protein